MYSEIEMGNTITEAQVLVKPALYSDTEPGESRDPHGGCQLVVFFHFYTDLDPKRSRTIVLLLSFL